MIFSDTVGLRPGRRAQFGCINQEENNTAEKDWRSTVKRRRGCSGGFSLPSIVQTFSRSQGQQHMLPTQHHAWADYQQQNDNNNAEVYQHVQPGEPLDSRTSHVVVSLEENVSKADMHIGDLVYFTNQRMVTDMNVYLEAVQAPFGPFLYISDAAILLQQLKRKPNKAAQFRGYLVSFAAAHGLNANLFDQWLDVVWAKDRRDMAAHPLELCAEDLSYLKGLITDPNSPIQHYAAAVDALVKVAERLGLK